MQGGDLSFVICNLSFQTAGAGLIWPMARQLQNFEA
jgi:hypothetical protein